MRILVTGRSGQVVTALRERGAAQGIEILTFGRPEFDLADPEAGLAAMAAAQPDIIVSAAAYTAVDKAESDQIAAEAANSAGPGAVARLAAQLGVPVVHLSTDYVFDGTKAEPYLESDQTNPINAYGRTKLGGERAVEAATPNHVILRTAWVYSPFGNNFVKSMLRAGAEQLELRVIEDQSGNPTSALDIADAVLLVARNLQDEPDNSDLRGIFHLAGAGEASWADFATEIFAMSRDLGGPFAKVTRITSADYPFLAKRPANSRLDTTKLHHTHAATLPSWRKSVRSTLTRLITAARAA